MRTMIVTWFHHPIGRPMFYHALGELFSYSRIFSKHSCFSFDVYSKILQNSWPIYREGVFLECPIWTGKLWKQTSRISCGLSLCKRSECTEEHLDCVI